MKKALLIVAIIAIVGATYGLYVYFKPSRDVRDEQAIPIAASAIFDSFMVNENRANELYLNKAILVTGEVVDFKQNQEGMAVVYLKTNDPVFGVNCTFKEDPGVIEKGSTISFKGICTGFLSDVIINQGVIEKK